ncbi:hypothetical protein V1509DRAFT_618129 [Lipomyces kononenkoae]
MSIGTPPEFSQRPHSRLPISTVNTSRVRPLSGFDFRSDFRSSNCATQIDSNGTHGFGELHPSAGPPTTLNAKLEFVRDKRRSTHRRSLSSSSAVPTLPEASISHRSRADTQIRRQPTLSVHDPPSMLKYGSRIESATPRVLKSFSGNRMGAVTTSDPVASDCPMTTSKQMTENSSSTLSSVVRRSETVSTSTSSSSISMHSLPTPRLRSESRRAIQSTPTSSTCSSTLPAARQQFVRPVSMNGTPSTGLSVKKSARPVSRLATPSTIRRPITSLSTAASSSTTNRLMDSSITTAAMMSPTTRRVATVHGQATRFANDDGETVNLASRPVTRPTTSLSRVKQTPSRIGRPLSVTVEALPQRKNLRSTARSKLVTETTVSVRSPERVSPIQSDSNQLIKAASLNLKPSSNNDLGAKSSPVNRITDAKGKSLKAKGKHRNMATAQVSPEDSMVASRTADDYYQRVIDAVDLSGASKVVHRRIQGAIQTGTLQLSDLGLGSVPDEVYELLQNRQEKRECQFDSITKAELTVFVAAHNSIGRLDERFADVLSQLVSIDLRANGFRKIPPSMSKLHSLTMLNLSANKLTNESLSVLFTIRSLVDLDIRSNRFDGEVPSSLCNLVSLEILNVDSNEFSSIAPSAFNGLCKLQRLSAKSNKLRRFPFDSIEASPIVELDLSYNKLSGSLISIDRISRFSELRVLNASHNQIKVVSDFAIMLPYLEILDLNSNIVVSLGMLLLCTPSLIQLHISRNMIPVLPEGIMELRNLKLLDISYNLFTNLDSRLGLIDSLETLRWNGNKVGERALAAMNTNEVKMRLRARYENEISEGRHDQDAPDDDAPDDEFLEMAVRKRLATSQSKSKQLDLSGREYSEVSFPDRVVEQYMPGHYYRYGSDAITELHLQRNEFSTIPDTIMSFAFADVLRSLNLSHNNLGEDAFKYSVALPSLLDINLSCNLISSLIMFVANFKLQNLQKLDLSFNKIRHVPLSLVVSFPTLEELNLHENKVSEIDAQAFKGLEKIDLSNNSIRYLPPELGKIKTIVKLKVHGNTFKTPRWQIVQKGTDALMEWLRQRLPEDADEPEAK